MKKPGLILLAIFSLLIATATLVKAQDRHGFFNITEIGYGKGIGRIDYGSGLT